MGDDHYAMLEIPSSASAREIRRAYRRLARRHHPDLNSRPDGAKRFAELARAYAILNDPSRRARYDQTLQQPAPGRPPTRARSSGVQRSAQRGILELSPSEGRHLARRPLTLTDGDGRTIVLPAGLEHMDEITLLYNGRAVTLRVRVQGKT